MSWASMLLLTISTFGVRHLVRLAASRQMVGKDQNEIAEWLKQRTTQNTEQAEECVKINYHGTKTVTEALLPLVQSSSDGRIVNVTSAFGLLRVRALIIHNRSSQFEGRKREITKHPMQSSSVLHVYPALWCSFSAARSSGRS